MDVWLNNDFLRIKNWNHPTETAIYNSNVSGSKIVREKVGPFLNLNLGYSFGLRGGS